MTYKDEFLMREFDINDSYYDENFNAQDDLTEKLARLLEERPYKLFTRHYNWRGDSASIIAETPEEITQFVLDGRHFEYTRLYFMPKTQEFYFVSSGHDVPVGTTIYLIPSV